MQTVTNRRSVLLPAARAASFAKCLAARGQSADVQVRESGRTQAARRYFVQWTPKSVTAHRKILSDAQAVRDQRGKEGAYEFRQSRCGRFYFCESARSGSCYETTVAHCTCPDYQYRLRGTGLRCRHSVALGAQLDAEANEQAEAEDHARSGYEQAEREACDAHAEWCREQVAERMAEDFGGGDW